MGNRVSSIPSPGIRSVNNVGTPGQNIDLTSNDASVVITPNISTKTIDLSVASSASAAGTTISNVPCDPSVYIGAWVIMLSGIANNALADSIADSNTVGVVEAKPTGTTCNIRFLGLTLPVFSGLDPTMTYYLSDTIPGGMSTSPPTTSGHVLLALGQPFSATEFLVIKGARVVRA